MCISLYMDTELLERLESDFIHVHNNTKYVQGL